MLRGELVGLRARTKDDVAVLHPAMHDDHTNWARTNTDAWVPIAADSEHSPFLPGEPNDKVAVFTAVALDSDEVIGGGLLWGIDTHSRLAHLGIGLVPAARGRGFGTDIVRVLCYYGFVVRGFRRLQLETLADNHAMIGSASKVGFVVEGTLRANAYVNGEVIDEVIMGLLAEEFQS